MKSKTVQRWVALGLGLLWIASVGASTARADGSSGERRPTVQISVYNDAGLKRGTVRFAEEEAATVFRRAGIDAEWKNCPSEAISAPSGESCGEVSYPSKLVLRIEKRPRGLVPEVFGIAYLTQDGQGAYCDVFVEPMVELQRMYPVGLDAMLGHVAAHEIAHLLLGAHSHSPNGLMRAHWNSRSIEDIRRGVLGFNSAQSSLMADRLVFARDSAGVTALAVMSEPAPATFTSLPAQCPDAH
jgi:hypothetical protein